MKALWTAARSWRSTEAAAVNRNPKTSSYSRLGWIGALVGILPTKWLGVHLADQSVCIYHKVHEYLPVEPVESRFPRLDLDGGRGLGLV